MKEFRVQALGEMWDLVEKDQELGRNMLPSDPSRMDVLARMEEVCLSKDYSNKRSNLELAGDLMMESQGVVYDDRDEDVDMMRKRCLARACSMLDPLLFDRAFFDAMREEIGTLPPRSSATHVKVLQVCTLVPV